jgi:hypothetical protein
VLNVLLVSKIPDLSPFPAWRRLVLRVKVEITRIVTIKSFFKASM